ncbi:MAG: T9SS type A sorting domain-containing protein [Taibaiella sp.]|nr:T9SS type A sorting domain-containing protein [Taibaiella sp.]
MKITNFRFWMLAAGIFLSDQGWTQPEFWTQTEQSSLQEVNRRILPDQFHLLQLDNEAIRVFLFSLGQEPEQARVMMIPNPDGIFEAFSVWETPMMEQGLAGKFPDIRTFSAVKVDDPFVTAKFDYTRYGFHGIVFGNRGTYYLDPVSFKGGSQYQVYYKSDYHPSSKQKTVCHVGDPQMPELFSEEEIVRTGRDGALPPLQRTHGNQKKTYRLALACTGEYAQAVTGSSSPTKAEVLSAMITTMNRVNGIYERELSVHMNLIDNNEDIIFTNPSTDPYMYNFNGYFLMDENQDNLEEIIGLSNFDIGHVFSTGGGGIASLGSVCYNYAKAQGVTGSPEPYGDPYDVDYVAHEMGHQFGANHTFNNCSGNENDPTAFEPGSGSTIMGYAGICGTVNNLQSNSDDYFHSASLNEISAYITGESLGGTGVCGSAGLGSTVITIPAYEAEYYIPTNTAFEVEAPEASWSSAELRYTWEQYNLGQVGRAENLGTTAISAPVFRSYKVADNSRVRSFPHSDSVHQNIYTYKGERTPDVEREVKTRLVVRGMGSDGYGSFNTSSDEITVKYHNTGSPFTVLSPNTSGVTWSTGSTQTVTWDVAGTTGAPINTAQVTIYLSRTGGATYPYILAENVPNTGSATITIPEGMATTEARVKIKGSGNVFYDVSDADFTITGSSTSIQDSEYTHEFKVYPNPVSDRLHIEHLGDSKPVGISVRNILGQRIYHTTANEAATIEAGKWSDGVYILEIQDVKTGETGSYKIIKQSK